jgi:NAD(P)-dependent dehydrogenase (short-subunit alcohol dehydrogenase family)
VDLQLTGKRALVTGGSRGIGKAVARALAEEGCDVALAARDRATLDASAAELAAATGRKVIGVEVDTGDDASVRAMVAAVVARLGGVDILVNNAAMPLGQSAPPKLADIDDDVFWGDVNVKVMGYVRCAREVAPLMAANGWGRIVNISGLGARSTGSAVGSIRNVGVAALTKNLADELARSGINVTVVHPGLTRTEKTPGVIAARSEASGQTPEEVERRMGAGNALGRLVDADEVAAVVAFLASPRSVAINGDAIACGGGQLGVIHY